MNAFLLLTLAAAVSMLVIPVVLRFAPRLGLLDMPDARKVHAAPVPRIGGWGITIGSLLALLLSLKLDPLLQSFVLGSATLFMFGIWDDAKQISHWAKFGGQILAAGIVVYHGDLYVSRLPFIDTELNAAVGKPFTVFALVGIVNAINHSDGLDGLAAGECVLSLIAMAILGKLADNALVLGIALAMIGALLGFLRYNSHPAQVFMGDSGSQVLGFSLGFLAVYLTQAGHTAVSAALPLLLLGLPVADILAVLYQRIRGGSNWFKASRNHVHHRLLDLGFSHYEAVVAIYSIQAVLVVSALLLRYESDTVVTATYLIVILGLFAGLILAERRGWRLRRDVALDSTIAIRAQLFKDSDTVRRILVALIATAIPLFILASALCVASIPRDLAITSAVLAAVLAAGLLRAGAAGSMLVRAAIYVTMVFSAYLIIHYPGALQRSAAGLAPAFIVVLTAAIGTYARFARDGKFETTPTDVLIALGVLALLVLGGISSDSRATVELVIYAAVLMYGCEIIGRLAHHRVLHLSALATLTIMAVRGVM